MKTSGLTKRELIEQIRALQERVVRLEGERLQPPREVTPVEAELCLSEERFRKVFEDGPLGMVIAGLDTRFSAANLAFCRMLGYTEEELKALSFLDVTHPDHRESDLTNIRRVVAGHQPVYHTEKRYLRKDGGVIWGAATVSTLREAEGTGLSLMAMVEDISLRKQAEYALAEKTAELARSNRELEQFAAIAAHDLQAPLRAVSSYLTLIARRYNDRLDENGREFIAYALGGTARMKTLINDLLTYSRVGTRGSRFAPTDCQAVFERVQHNLALTIKEQQAQVSSDVLPFILADETQLEQLLQNLVENAIKFHGPERPRVHVGAERRQIPGSEQAEWLFSVRDNGIGIDPQFAERVFEIFQRLNTRSDYQGNGIGLAVSKRIVERHGGKIWVVSQPGQGACFYFTVPIQAVLLDEAIFKPMEMMR